MIDTHCHILPGLDDGPDALEVALEMAGLAVADGVRQVVATPHQEGWNLAACQRAQAAVQSLQRELVLNNVKLALHGGAEIMMTHALLDAPGHDRAHTLNGSRYILIELPANHYPLYTAEVVFNLQIRGLVPVLAHPERHPALQDNVNLLAGLVQRGVLCQLTARSLTDAAGSDERRCAEQLLRRWLVQLLVSDAHDTGVRGPALSAGVHAAGRIVGQERARAMVTRIPKAILADQHLDPSALAPPEPGRWWQGFHLLRRGKHS